MASNFFGNIFRITTWGESHGDSIGVVIDGCPSGIEIDESEINAELALRSPGKSIYTSPRKEKDQARILSGVFHGKTSGAPICLLIPNQDVDSTHYEPIKDLVRPGHANYTYTEKYGVYDYRGGGRSSARETTARVAAGAIAKKFLAHFDIQISAFVKQIGHVIAHPHCADIAKLRILTLGNVIYCPDEFAAQSMIDLLDKVMKEGDSLGGIVEFIAGGLPVGLGDPVYEKIEAKLAHAMMSLPATKGFEIGSGFQCAGLKGSQHNDLFDNSDGSIKTLTNFSGGTLGGISNGMPLMGRVAFKPASGIRKEQKTVTLSGEPASFKFAEGARHDPCVAIRAVIVVEAMLALVLADMILLNRCAKL